VEVPDSTVCWWPRLWADKDLDQLKLKTEQLVGVAAVGTDVVLGHEPLALTQKARSREPGSEDLHANECFQFRATLG